MIFHTLPHAQDHFFDVAWKLYEEAFPSNEKRFLEEHLQLLTNASYTFQAIHKKDTLIGIIGFWEIEEFIFIEHFAIHPFVRGKNYGTLILSKFLKEKTHVILEIEPPIDEQSFKRLHFYEKLGFVQNAIPHFQVPFRKGDIPIALELLSYQTPIKQDKYYSLYLSMQQMLPV